MADLVPISPCNLLHRDLVHPVPFLRVTFFRAIHILASQISAPALITKFYSSNFAVLVTQVCSWLCSSEYGHAWSIAVLRIILSLLPTFGLLSRFVRVTADHQVITKAKILALTVRQNSKRRGTHMKCQTPVAGREEVTQVMTQRYLHMRTSEPEDDAVIIGSNGSGSLDLDTPELNSVLQVHFRTSLHLGRERNGQKAFESQNSNMIYIFEDDQRLNIEEANAFL